MRGLSFVWLEITGRCQLECIHCYAASGPRGTNGTMSLDDWTGVIDQADYWTGNKDAVTIVGVPKPVVLDLHEWAEEGGDRNRAELMTLVSDKPCSGTQELHTELDLPDQWWRELRTALETLAGPRGI
jgi:hypothetical protein